MIYWQLFLTFFKIGLFGFGGGNAMISLIQFEVVQRHAWLTNPEFTNMVAVSQVTPGPVGINCATYTGYLASGNVFGAFLATFSLVLPSFIIMLLIAKMLTKLKNNPYFEGAMNGLRPAIVGLIAAAALLLSDKGTFGEHYSDVISWIIFAVAFASVKFFKVNPIIVILVTAVAGIFIY